MLSQTLYPGCGQPGGGGVFRSHLAWPTSCPGFPGGQACWDQQTLWGGGKEQDKNFGFPTLGSSSLCSQPQELCLALGGLAGGSQLGMERWQSRK